MKGKFGVQLGDGRRHKSEGMCRGIVVSLPGCEVTADCYMFALGAVGVILGVAWLATLGEVRTNWENMTMSFDLGDHTVVLRGDPTLCRSPVGLRTLMRTREIAFWAIVLEHEPARLMEPRVEQLGEVLRQFEEIFGEPQGLPP